MSSDSDDERPLVLDLKAMDDPSSSGIPQSPESELERPSSPGAGYYIDTRRQEDLQPTGTSSGVSRSEDSRRPELVQPGISSGFGYFGNLARPDLLEQLDQPGPSSGVIRSRDSRCLDLEVAGTSSGMTHSTGRNFYRELQPTTSSSHTRASSADPDERTIYGDYRNYEEFSYDSASAAGREFLRTIDQPGISHGTYSEGYHTGKPDTGNENDPEPENLSMDNQPSHGIKIASFARFIALPEAHVQHLLITRKCRSAPSSPGSPGSTPESTPELEEEFEGESNIQITEELRLIMASKPVIVQPTHQFEEPHVVGYVDLVTPSPPLIKEEAEDEYEEYAAADAPRYGVFVHEDPGHVAPVHGSPGHVDAGHQEPGDEDPGHGVPGHEDPGHGGSGHEDPGHGGPGHEDKGHEDPGHAVPEVKKRKVDIFM